MTRGASGHFACESGDGTTLLFQPEDADSPLMAMALTGGERAAARSVRQKQRLWRWSARRVLRAMRRRRRCAGFMS